MNPRLRVDVGRQVGFEYEIPPKEETEAVWLGRGGFCQIRLADNQLSRRHSQFSFCDGVLYVEDLGSKNGTLVNGEPVRDRLAIKDGDRITVGSHELVVIHPTPTSDRAGVLAPLGQREEEENAFQELAHQVGSDFGGYVVEKVIFNGTASVVFRARQVQTGTPAAVKVLKRLKRVTVEDQNRFLRGARHSAALRHENFVRVYKGGRVHEWFYIAMEYAPGRNLVEIVEHKGGPLEVKTALRIADQVLDALQYAYEQDIVFRAVRPDNIIITEGMTVKLTDFDLVKPLAGRQDAQVTRVMDGSLKVDPAFAAPELIAYPVVADQKADVFGAGAVLYYMLCARPPFGGALPADKLTSAFDRVAVPPREINPEVPEAVCEVLKQAMSDYDRYATPGAMREALAQAAAEVRH
ncbi:MAG: protein kinase [Candidatus Brocadiaceae bacterium]|nr:protein kinase [Candidatus Brocadiaceae bacterium]